MPIDELPVEQARAIGAFEGGLITIGKLAELLFMHVLDLRRWLSEHSIDHGTALSADDHRYA